MHRGILIWSLPWLALLVGALLMMRWLVALSGAKLQIGRLGNLHRDQAGSVQSLSFVLTLPVFVMFLLLIVQISQVWVAKIVVEYSAIAAARSAIVWIPAQVASLYEGENCLSSHYVDPDQTGVQNGTRYIINPAGVKYARIKSAAVLGCLPIAPSRPIAGVPAPAAGVAAVLQATYRSIAPGSANNARISQRIQNKLAYSSQNTDIRLSFVHKDVEPPLADWLIPDDINEFTFNEVGWQDPITVTVYHRLALLPGPGRLLFRQAASPNGRPDQVSQEITRSGDTYTINLSASATLGNEGEKPVLSYVYQP